jgi:hypothetical protein
MVLTQEELQEEVVAVLQGTVLHQRARWGALLGHQRQFEGWWKAEFAAALEAWTWSSRVPDPGFCVLVEPKPRDFRAVDGDCREAADLAIAPWGDDGQDVSEGQGTRDGQRPRLWIELKTRATWWGSTTSAVGKALGGFRSDLVKWEALRGDPVLVCHLVTHDGTYRNRLPPEWAAALPELREEEQPRWHWPGEPFTVGIEAAVGGRLRHRWTRMDCVIVNPLP